MAQARETMSIQTDVRGIAEPTAVSVTFMFERPRSHYKSSGGLRETAPREVTRTPDIDNYQQLTCVPLLTHSACTLALANG